MSRKKLCCLCEKKLTKDETALNLKLLEPEENEYYCLPCMAEYIGCTEEDLHVKIQEFKEQGCALFL